MKKNLLEKVFKGANHLLKESEETIRTKHLDIQSMLEDKASLLSKIDDIDSSIRSAENDITKIEKLTEMLKKFN